METVELGCEKRDTHTKVNRHYESWIERYTRGPLLVIESDTVDFVNRKEDLEKVVGMIRKTLGMTVRR